MDIYKKELTRQGSQSVESDVNTLYTHPGQQYEQRAIKTGIRGWSKKGIYRFNELVDAVRKDRVTKSQFFVDWISGYRKGKTKPKTSKREVYDPSLFPKDDLFQTEATMIETDTNQNVGTIKD